MTKDDGKDRSLVDPFRWIWSLKMTRKKPRPMKKGTRRRPVFIPTQPHSPLLTQL